MLSLCVQWSWPTVPLATVLITGCLQLQKRHILTQFQPKPLSFSFQPFLQMNISWAKAAPTAHWLWSLRPDASGAGVILQADSDPGRDESSVFFSSANMSRGVGDLGEGGCWGSGYIVPYSAPFSSVVTLQGCSAHWGDQGKGKWRVMIPAVHVLDTDANTAWRGSIGNIFSSPLRL